MRTTADFSKADQVIQTALAEGQFTSACLLAGRGERILHRRAYGRLDMDDDAAETLLQSICKELGKIDITDFHQKYAESEIF